MMQGDKPVSEIIKPNTEDLDGDYWDPWDALGLGCCSYNSEIDDNALSVLRLIGTGPRYTTDIAEATGMAESHVELLQSIFCSAGWCEYGTSPRGCWPIDREGWPSLIAAWEAYYLRHWEQPASGIEAPSGGETGTGSTEGESPTGEAGDAQGG